MSTWTIDTWTHCYGEPWKDIATEACHAHPAKFSKALCFRLVAHALEEGWLTPGVSRCLDPFAGVCLGALPLALEGIQFIGCELEQHFYNLANGFDCDGVVISVLRGTFTPAESLRQQWFITDGVDRWGPGGLCDPGEAGFPTAEAAQTWWDAHPTTFEPEDEVLLALLTLIPATPAYLTFAWAVETPARCGQQEAHDPHHVLGNLELWERRYGGLKQWRTPVLVQGNSMHLRAVLQTAGVEVCLSSPPWQDSLASTTGTGTRIAAFKNTMARDGHGHPGRVTSPNGYGTSPGQLGNLPPGSVEAVLSSPPHGNSLSHTGTIDRSKFVDGSKHQEPHGQYSHAGERDAGKYGTSPAQLGNAAPTDFWSAAKQIVAETFALLAPGGHAIWVTKSYVRDNKIVDFPNQWRALCESCGFVTLHEHRAMQVDHHEELGLFGEPVTMHHVEKKGFFRRLHEKKHPETRIDHETVWCMQKPGDAAGEEEGVSACVSSPPWGEGVKKEQTRLDASAASIPSRKNAGPLPKPYGTSPGQLGAMRPGTPPDMVLSSPPYAGAGEVLGTHNGIDYSKARTGGKTRTPARDAIGRTYGETEGQLGAMRPGTSPEEAP